MKIVLAGGGGQIGKILTRAFLKDGHEIVVLSRGDARLVGCQTSFWDGKSNGDWMREIDGADVVINLAGRSVNCRYNAANRKAIIDSRVDSTAALGRAIQKAARPPNVWLQSSTATIYAHRFDAPNDEAAGILGGHEPGVPETWRFSIEVATRWERAALEASFLGGTRLVLMRSAMVMSPDPGGVFDTLLGLVRRRLGGRNGSGRQYVSWIHEYDFINAVGRLIDDPAFLGPINLASPCPMPNTDFMRELREAWGTRIGLPSTEWMLALGAVFMQTETELILKSRRVAPGRLLAAGFEFQFSEWRKASEELIARWRKQRAL